MLATPGSRVINNTAHAYKLAEFTTEGLINADTSDVNANSNHLHCNGISSDVRDVESLTSGTLDDVDVEDVRNAQEAGVLLGEFSQTKNNLSVTSGVAYAQSKLALILFTRKLASKFGNGKFRQVSYYYFYYYLVLSEIFRGLLNFRTEKRTRKTRCVLRLASFHCQCSKCLIIHMQYLNLF